MQTGETGSEGKHTAHVTDRSQDCELCHENYPDQATHMNGTFGNPAETVDFVDFGGSFLSQSVTGTFANDATGNCSDLSCHGGTGSSGRWYATDTIACSECHNGNDVNHVIMRTIP